MEATSFCEATNFAKFWVSPARSRSPRIIKSSFCNPDNVSLYKFSTFPRTIFGMFDATFPFHHSPTAVAILG